MNGTPRTGTETPHIAKCARAALDHMAAHRVPLTPENYARHYGDAARRQGLPLLPGQPSRNLTAPLKDLVVALLQQLRGVLGRNAKDVHGFIELESAVGAAEGAEHVAVLKQNLRQTVERLDAASKAAEIQGNERFRSVVDALLQAFRTQVASGGELAGQLGLHVAELDDLAVAEMDDCLLDRLQAVANEVRGTATKMQRQQEDAGKKIEESQREIHRLKNELRSRERQAVTDELTRIYNRRAFNSKLEEEVERYSRYGIACSLILFDIDHFKGFNDAYGHQAGDEVLRAVADVVSRHVRKNDFFARYGGEEFAVIAATAEIEGAATLAEKVRKKVEDIRFVYNEETITVTISCGVGQVAPGDSRADLVKRADDCLYRAKAAGRNQVCAEAAAT